MALDTKTSKPEKWEYLVPVLVTVSLLIACAIASAKKTFWNDELLSFYLLSDSSFTHMMGAWGDTFNQVFSQLVHYNYLFLVERISTLTYEAKVTFFYIYWSATKG